MTVGFVVLSRRPSQTHHVLVRGRSESSPATSSGLSVETIWRWKCEMKGGMTLGMDGGRYLADAVPLSDIGRALRRRGIHATVVRARWLIAAASQFTKFPISSTAVAPLQRGVRWGNLLEEVQASLCKSPPEGCDRSLVAPQHPWHDSRLAVSKGCSSSTTRVSAPQLLDCAIACCTDQASATSCTIARTVPTAIPSEALPAADD